jgi:hypothetical protein
MCMPPVIGGVAAAQQVGTASGSGAINLPVITKPRTLGSGSYRMEVSALGFGVMGMNYKRARRSARFPRCIYRLGL